MMPRFCTISLALTIWCGTPRFANAGKLTRVWEIDLRQAVKAKNGMAEFPVFALRFSPDGHKLAVIADVYNTDGGRKSRLLVGRVDHPPTNFKEFEVEFGILDNGRLGALNFGWAPSGEIVYAVGKVAHLAEGTTCDLPNQSVFVSDDVAMSTRGVPPSGNITGTQIKFYDGSCKERGQWDVPESWLVSDVSTDRGMLSVLREISIGRAEDLIVDPMARKVVQRWNGSRAGGWQFADSGRAMCQGGAGFNPERTPTLCRNVDTGKEIGETLKTGAEPIETAAHSLRVVVTDYQRTKIPFSYEYHSEFKGRYVWDFRTGQELASWHPESQTYPSVFSPAKTITEPYCFTMSPDGQFVAEGGNGIIRLYKIEP